MHEMLRAHRELSRAERADRISAALDDVGLEAGIAGRYPFQVSGGQLQRAALAMAVLLEPELLIADEPTTALDSWSAERVLEHIARIRDEQGCAVLFITHDLRIMRRYADRVAIMRDGEIVEHGPKHAVVAQPRHAYTRNLLDSIPPLRSRPDRLPIAGEAAGGGALEGISARRSPSSGPVLVASNLRKVYASGTVAVDDVSLELAAGATLGLVGESGSGKSTLARCVLTLQRLDGGELQLGGAPLHTLRGPQLRAARQRMQVVLQDPHASFNNRLPVIESLLEPLECQRRLVPGFLPEARTPREVGEGLLGLVGLGPDFLDKRPQQLSGGEKQRVAIARAISVEPELIVLDEPTASLDVSTQARVLNLLKDLQDGLGLSYLFISHDLSAVHFMSDRLMVMQQGRIVDDFAREELFAVDRHEYTRQLIALFDESPAAL